MNLSPVPVQKFFSNIGLPLVGGKLFTYAAGTTTKIATYTDSSGVTQNTNPIILNFRGECRLWIDPTLAYKFILSGPLDTDPPTNPIWTVDDITAGPAPRDNAAVDTGSVNNIQLTIPLISSPVAFTRIVFRAANTNTGSTTISINGGTAKNVTWQNIGAFAGGEIQANGLYEAIYDGAQWQLQGPTLDPTQMRTTAEVNAGVTPLNYAIPSHTATGFVIPDRYATNTTPGTTNMATAWANAILVATQALTCVKGAGQIYRCDSGLSIDVNKVRVDLNGSTLDFSNLTTGHAISFTQSEPDVNVRPLKNTSHAFENGYLIGPGVATTAVDCFYFNESTSDSVPCVAISNVGVRDFATDVTFADGAFCANFIACAFTYTTGVATTYSVVQNDAANSGERQTFVGCIWFNKKFILNNLSSAGGDIFLIGCSLDYFTRAVTVSAGGLVFLSGCHIESNTDADYWFHCSGTNAALVVSGSQIAMTGNKTAFDMFFSDPTATNGGITLSDVTCGFGANTFTTRLIGGAGLAKVDNLIQSNASPHPVISSYLNVLAYPGFESANYTAEWTLAGTIPAVRSNAQAHTGTWSLSLPGAAGNDPSAFMTTPCRPGQYFQGEYWYLSPTITGTNATFFGQIDFLDKGGNALATTPITTITTNVVAWTLAGFKSTIPAPSGTVNARLFFSVSGIASGNATSYVDDIIAGVA